MESFGDSAWAEEINKGIHTGAINMHHIDGEELNELCNWVDGIDSDFERLMRENEDDSQPSTIQGTEQPQMERLEILVEGHVGHDNATQSPPIQPSEPLTPPPEEGENRKKKGHVALENKTDLLPASSGQEESFGTTQLVEAQPLGHADLSTLMKPRRSPFFMKRPYKRAGHRLTVPYEPQDQEGIRRSPRLLKKAASFDYPEPFHDISVETYEDQLRKSKKFEYVHREHSCLVDQGFVKYEFEIPNNPDYELNKLSEISLVFSF